MKSTIAACLAIAFVSGSASAQTLLPDTYQTVCQTESTIGYSWKGGRYVISRYEPATFTIEVGDAGRCKANPAKNIEMKDVLSRDVCAIITRVGETRRPMLATHCSEVYLSEGAASSVSLQCEQIIGESVWADPDGLFHVTLIHPSTAARPRNDYKDSLSLGVGRCRRTD